jgi:hypothetical protein
MRLDIISGNDWEQFEKEHYHAYMFLLRASLRGELRHLEQIKHPNAWEIARRNELRMAPCNLSEGR